MIDYNFRYIGRIDLTSIVEKLSNISSSDWEEYDFRQTTYDNHRHTQCIPIIYDEDFRLNNLTHTKWYSLFEDELEILKSRAVNFYGKGYINRCILAKLKSHKEIPVHVDGGTALSLGKRIHLPIVTDDEVVFEVGSELNNMKEGELWEINNVNKFHGVRNNSNNDRIHLIYDYISQINTREEFINDLIFGG